MKYIIQHGVQIENPESNIINVINVLTQDQMNDYLKKGCLYKERIYKLTIGHSQYEVICIEIWKKNDTEHSLITPAFFIVHRTYPLYVYAYAINMYCTSPGISQRKVAEDTRKKFDLKTFAHTTVGRAVKALAKVFAETETEECDATITDAQMNRQNSTAHGNETDKGTDCSKELAKIQDAKALWEFARSFFYSKPNNFSLQGLKEACDFIADCWRKKYHRFLI